MASFNLTGEYDYLLPTFEENINHDFLVEDSSPLITYSPAGSWVDSPTNDLLATVNILINRLFHTSLTDGI